MPRPFYLGASAAGARACATFASGTGRGAGAAGKKALQTAAGRLLFPRPPHDGDHLAAAEEGRAHRDPDELVARARRLKNLLLHGRGLLRREQLVLPQPRLGLAVAFEDDHHLCAEGLLEDRLIPVLETCVAGLL